MEEKKIHILLVEDDEVDVMNVRRAFKKNNIVNPLYMAANGLEALAILRQDEKIEPVMPKTRRLVLLDLNMPRMNGIEFLRELRQDEDLWMHVPSIWWKCLVPEHSAGGCLMPGDYWIR
jgi:CheY-like chemotaxis protein